MELMVVIAIIGILAAIAIPNYISYRQRTLIAQAQAELKSLEKVIKMMALDTNCYPSGDNIADFEMGGPEFKMRADKFPDITADQFKYGGHGVELYERSDGFQDVIKPGPQNLNIIDYLEVTKDFYLVGDFIKSIWEKLKGSIAIIAIQKAPGVELGSGGRFSLEKARLYVALDYGIAKIVSCKNFKPDNPIGNPRGMEYNFKLIDGCRYKKEMGWHTPAL